MDKILVTGASGNVGFEVIRGLKEISGNVKIVAGDYHIGRAREILDQFSDLEYRQLDFADPSGFDAALEEIDVVFLLRPPHLADVPKYFEPFIEKMIEKNIHKLVFLSVQGVENQKSIPHHKLENLITEKGLEYCFLRPSYFMQNLTTTLVREIREESKIFIPSGKLKFTWVDARDIGLVGAHVLTDFDSFKNQALEITGNEQKNFYEVAEILSSKLNRKITYQSPNLIKFFRKKKKAGISNMMIFVMIMLHYLPRFSKKKSRTTDTVKKITGREPGNLADFLERTKDTFEPK